MKAETYGRLPKLKGRIAHWPTRGAPDVTLRSLLDHLSHGPGKIYYSEIYRPMPLSDGEQLELMRVSAQGWNVEINFDSSTWNPSDGSNGGTILLAFYRPGADPREEKPKVKPGFTYVDARSENS